MVLVFHSTRTTCSKYEEGSGEGGMNSNTKCERVEKTSTSTDTKFEGVKGVIR